MTHTNSPSSSHHAPRHRPLSPEYRRRHPGHRANLGHPTHHPNPTRHPHRIDVVTPATPPSVRPRLHATTQHSTPSRFSQCPPPHRHHRPRRSTRCLAFPQPLARKKSCTHRHRRTPSRNGRAARPPPPRPRRKRPTRQSFGHFTMPKNLPVRPTNPLRVPEFPRPQDLHLSRSPGGKLEHPPQSHPYPTASRSPPKSHSHTPHPLRPRPRNPPQKPRRTGAVSRACSHPFSTRHQPRPTRSHRTRNP